MVLGKRGEKSHGTAALASRKLLARASARVILGDMVRDIKKHLEKTPFVPFTIRTADGHEYVVPTRDHVYVRRARDE